jgi:hypothetical protein
MATLTSFTPASFHQGYELLCFCIRKSLTRDLDQIKDYESLVDQTSHIIRPGGLLDMMEFDFKVYGPDRKPIIPLTSVMEAPWLPRWMTFLNMAARQRGGDVDAANKLDDWVSAHPAFEQKVYRDFYIPTSPWARGDDAYAHRKRREGTTMRDDIKVGRHKYSYANRANGRFASCRSS